MKIENINISKLKPAPYNPRKSTEKQELKLKQSLEKFGVVEPIIYNKRTGHIVGGHFRVRELTKLGYKEVPCVIVDLSMEDEKELNIRLNANTGEWDFEMLKIDFDQDLLSEWGLDVKDLKIEEQITPPAEITMGKLFYLSIKCKDEQQCQEMYENFIKQGFEVKIIT